MGDHHDTGLSLQLFMAGDDDIIVTQDWKPRPGDPMPQMADVRIGKQFGAGALAFNTIYDLVDDRGKSIGQALKACKPTLAARRSLAHEWKMFKDLSMLANDFQAARSHFLQAHRVVRLHDGRISGIVMEKANGQNVIKTLRDPRFCNVRYVITLLRDLLVGLDVAQRVLGFTHYDLKLDNVIEHWHGDPEKGQARLMIDAVPQFKIFDFGTAVVYPDPFSMHEAVDSDLNEQKPDAAAHLAEQKPHNRRGRVNDREAVERYASGYEYSTPFCCVRIYHMWWKQRGDVYRVLLALCRDLDNHTWPVEDLELVSLLFTVLEHTTMGKRLRAKFEPRSVLLHKLYGPHPPPAPLDTSHSTGLTRAQTAALLQQHSQLVLQGSASVRLASQGSTLLPSTAAIEAYGRQQQQQQPHNPQQRHQKHGVQMQHLQGVAEVGSEGSEDAEGEGQSPVAAVGTPSRNHPLRINTTKIPAGVTSSTTTTAAAAVAGDRGATPLPPPSPTHPATGGQHTPRRNADIIPPPSPTYTAGRGQYTPRRSTEVPREDPSSAAVPGMRYVRLAKAQEPAAAAAAMTPTAAAAAAVAAAATHIGDGAGWTTTFTRYPAAADTAAAGTVASAAAAEAAMNGSASFSTPPASPFAGSGAQGGSGTTHKGFVSATGPGSNNSSVTSDPRCSSSVKVPAAGTVGVQGSSTYSTGGGSAGGSPARSIGGGGGAGIPGVQQMVTAETAEQRKVRQQKAIALTQQQQQQQQQQQAPNTTNNMNSTQASSDGGKSSGGEGKGKESAVAAATAAAAAAAPAPAGDKLILPSGHEYELEAAPTGVPGPLAPGPDGMSSNTPADRRAENRDHKTDPGQPSRHDSAGTHSTLAQTPLILKPPPCVLRPHPPPPHSPGVPDPFAPGPDGMSSNTPADRRAENRDHKTDPGQPSRHDSAGTLVAKQPMATTAQQSVLGSRKALKGVTAQQLLVEPLVQSLLSKV